jgi:hypothetical protein
MNWQDLTSTGRLLRTRALGWTEGRAAARLLDLGDRHRGERALLVADLSVRQVQPVQAAAVCQGQRAAKNVSRLLENAMLQRVSRRRIARLAADIDLLDERLLKIVAGDAALAHRYRLLTSMPGGRRRAGLRRTVA